MAAQLRPVLGDPAASLAVSGEAIEAAARAGARLVVLPELASAGYCFRDAAEARLAAEPVPGPTTEGWRRLAQRHGLVVVGGVLELDDAGELRNTQVLVDGAGVRASYRKLHLWGTEAALFRPGDRPAPVVDCGVGRIGLAVCYDLWFPELTRALALDGADLLAISANLTGDPPQRGRPHLYVTTTVATAYLNRVHVVLADRSGIERGVQWLGCSVVVDADGLLVAEAPPGGGDALLSAPLELAAARDKRWGPDNDLLADRRPELYAARLSAR